MIPRSSFWQKRLSCVTQEDEVLTDQISVNQFHSTEF